MDLPKSFRTFNREEQEIFKEILANRRDVRGHQFLIKGIPDREIDQILEAALMAPSVGFSQPWEFVIIKDLETKLAIKNSFEEKNQEASHLFEEKKQKAYDDLKLEGIIEAPLNIAVFYVPSKEPVLGQTAMPNMGRYSVACAIQNMWLMARSLNIGMGWVSILDAEKVKTILKAPEDRELIGYLCFGYTDGFYSKPELELKKWDKRKLWKEVVVNGKYEVK
ncbi:5,6-dimethylbenzimidazole synthase [Aureivirga sp. CE67]|uniref:5,6-dimethylbenzimidazole synthase n=1 Tax=Aureivirga sp. CE67 TaxID=1788983 RepID=UPI0018C90E77|nr:5,6-dimethylbenzimidazole synthase [Aureivirga sp. CE67]